MSHNSDFTTVPILPKGRVLLRRPAAQQVHDYAMPDKAQISPCGSRIPVCRSGRCLLAHKTTWAFEGQYVPPTAMRHSFIRPEKSFVQMISMTGATKSRSPAPKPQAWRQITCGRRVQGMISLVDSYSRLQWLRRP